ncbi:hypothetical protein C8R43DRAFT_215102 [Mycena crocata]|nr:hypothetical protein C8R43DRAFT_215102 [Mycena crocata]
MQSPAVLDQTRHPYAAHPEPTVYSPRGVCARLASRTSRPNATSARTYFNTAFMCQQMQYLKNKSMNLRTRGAIPQLASPLARNSCLLPRDSPSANGIPVCVAVTQLRRISNPFQANQRRLRFEDRRTRQRTVTLRSHGRAFPQCRNWSSARSMHQRHFRARSESAYLTRCADSGLVSACPAASRPSASYRQGLAGVSFNA